MSDPIVDPSDLQLYMGLSTVNDDRAAMLLAQAQNLCETVVLPLPTGADAVILRMASLAYVSPTGGRPIRMGSLQIEYGGATTRGGVVLTPADEKELRRYAGSNIGAFSFDPTPADALSTLPFWDVDRSRSPSALTVVRPVVVVSANYIASAFDDVLVDAVAGPITIMVPALAAGETVTVQKTDVTANIVTVASSVGWLISGSSSYHLSTLSAVDFVPNGSALWAQ